MQAAAFHIIGRRTGFNSTSVFQDVGEYVSGNSFEDMTGSETLEIVSSSASDSAAAKLKVSTISSATANTNRIDADVSILLMQN